MKKNIVSWRAALGIALVLLSAVLYGFHYYIFHDAHHIFIYLLGDIAYIPVEVLIVTLVIHGLLDRYHKHRQRKKLIMVIGSFFSEVGVELLRMCARFDTRGYTGMHQCVPMSAWKAKDFMRQIKILEHNPGTIATGKASLVLFKDFLTQRRDFLLRLLENSHVLEHEEFSDLLWAVFHITEELGMRPDVAQFSDADRRHIEGDIQRAYAALARQWLRYMQHLSADYPYLFSLAVRAHPFQEAVSVCVA